MRKVATIVACLACSGAFARDKVDIAGLARLRADGAFCKIAGMREQAEERINAAYEFGAPQQERADAITEAQLVKLRSIADADGFCSKMESIYNSR